eukprot:403374983
MASAKIDTSVLTFIKAVFMLWIICHHHNWFLNMQPYHGIRVLQKASSRVAQVQNLDKNSKEKSNSQLIFDFYKSGEYAPDAFLLVSGFLSIMSYQNMKRMKSQVSQGDEKGIGKKSEVQKQVNQQKFIPRYLEYVSKRYIRLASVYLFYIFFQRHPEKSPITDCSASEWFNLIIMHRVISESNCVEILWNVDVAFQLALQSPFIFELLDKVNYFLKLLTTFTIWALSMYQFSIHGTRNYLTITRMHPYFMGVFAYLIVQKMRSWVLLFQFELMVRWVYVYGFSIQFSINVFDNNLFRIRQENKPYFNWAI